MLDNLVSLVMVRLKILFTSHSIYINLPHFNNSLFTLGWRLIYSIKDLLIGIKDLLYRF